MRLIVQPAAFQFLLGSKELRMFVAVSLSETGAPVSGLNSSQFRVVVDNIGLPVTITGFKEYKLEPDNKTNAGVYTFNLTVSMPWFDPVRMDYPIAVQVSFLKQNGPWSGQGVTVASWKPTPK